MTKKVVTLKLISGDEVIGEEISRTDSTITLETPLMVVPAAGNNLAFMPAAFTAAPHQHLTFNFSAMSILPFDSNAEFTKVYVEKTSGLILR